MITHDGKVIANEVMPTLGVVKMLGVSNPSAVSDKLS